MTFLRASYNKLFFNKLSIPACLAPSYLPSLDGLRGVAILCVIFSHSLLDHGINYFCYALGMIGVQIFFVISGFLITSLLLKEKILKGTVSLGNFYIRRFLRLAPVAYLYLVVAALLAYIFKLDLSLGALLSAALYVKNLPISNGHDRLVGHYWTLSIEEQFYLIFPVVLVYKTNKYLVLIISLLILIPTLSFLGYNKIGFFYTNRIIHLFTFIIINLFGNGTFAILTGSLFSILTFKGVINTERIKNPYLLSILIFLFIIVIRTVTVYSIFNVDIGIILFSAGMGYIILLNLNGPNFLNTILTNPLVIKVGVLSYSLYIWQALFTHFFIWDKWFIYSHSLWLNLPLLFMVAYLSYHFYEKHFLKIKARF